MKTLLVLIFVLVALAILGAIAYNTYHRDNERRLLTVNQQQAVQLISSCKISQLNQSQDEIELSYNDSDKAAQAASDATGKGFFIRLSIQIGIL